MSFRVTIEGLVYGGSGIARRPDGKVVFVPFSVPGDVCTVEVVEDKRDFSRARIVKIEEPSPIRKEPFCPLFGECGGCQLQYLSYTDQLQWKKRIFQDSIKRSTGIELIPQVVPSPARDSCRIRATFHVEDGRVGFFRASTHRVVEVECCPLLEPSINTTLEEIKEEIPEGVHTLDIAVDMDGGGTTAVFHVENPSVRVNIPLSSRLKGYEVRVKGRFQRGRGKELYRTGNTECSYTLDGIRLLYSAGVFFQVNPGANSALVDKVLEATEDALTAVDAFCGVGNFSLPLTRRAHRVEGFDIDPLAIEYAKRSANINHIQGVEFHRMDAERGKILEKKMPSVVVLDPPRGGCRRLAGEVARRGIERVIYVSCNPSTLGRDLKEFLERSYRVVSSALIDMFPHTYHVESILVLTL